MCLSNFGHGSWRIRNLFAYFGTPVKLQLTSNASEIQTEGFISLRLFPPILFINIDSLWQLCFIKGFFDRSKKLSGGWFYFPCYFMFFVVIVPDTYFHSRSASLTDKSKRAVPTVSVKKGVLLKLSLLILLSSATPLFVGAMIQLHATSLIRRATFTSCSPLHKNTTERRLATIFICSAMLST